MDAVVLAACSAALFGGMTVALRVALRRDPDAEAGALATVTVALAVALLAALARGRAGLDAPELALFLAAGLLGPGGSQLLFTLAVRDAGASRTSVIVGTAPLAAVAIALVVLDEPFSAPLALGALLVVTGGVALVADRARPPHFRAIGLVFALAGTVLFAVRDNFVRWASDGTTVTPGAGAVATLLGGGVAIAAYLTVARRRSPDLTKARLRGFAPTGVLFGLSYICLFEAYYRGRVSVVSPIVATETLWGVGLSALLLRRSELVGRRLLAGAALIVAGGALIGAHR